MSTCLVLVCSFCLQALWVHGWPLFEWSVRALSWSLKKSCLPLRSKTLPPCLQWDRLVPDTLNQMLSDWGLGSGVCCGHRLSLGS